ncbi:hypothetical protein SPRG_08804 [Saprolegnia parasitica CBS 223.65]|uniref:Uncharacterized protein n=1 Tax=Saprolegnia parasitica (strain CBS 223.65) TaxID=695850 RepID=A0A067CH42_SAPPC|nr:hypothetical protein SPRG_08804 [Saprolegnia parasitica CBS 223.65]KDO25861.1 hypothetical protein SPRG_08804 [Saprolegnia parasitica CBS 223.65]|eukprot:XP_012203423.1 hypothetical protein SPRG_08804 [Saprolegnia parasitica CBS 223.65]
MCSTMETTRTLEELMPELGTAFAAQEASLYRCVSAMSTSIARAEDEARQKVSANEIQALRLKVRDTMDYVNEAKKTMHSLERSMETLSAEIESLKRENVEKDRAIVALQDDLEDARSSHDDQLTELDKSLSSFLRSRWSRKTSSSASRGKRGRLSTCATALRCSLNPSTMKAWMMTEASRPSRSTRSSMSLRLCLASRSVGPSPATHCRALRCQLTLSLFCVRTVAASAATTTSLDRPALPRTRYEHPLVGICQRGHQHQKPTVLLHRGFAQVLFRGAKQLPTTSFRLAKRLCHRLSPPRRMSQSQVHRPPQRLSHRWCFQQTRKPRSSQQPCRWHQRPQQQMPIQSLSKMKSRASQHSATNQRLHPSPVRHPVQTQFISKAIRRLRL